MKRRFKVYRLDGIDGRPEWDLAIERLCTAASTYGRLIVLSAQLGVHTAALELLRTGRDDHHDVWTWPMVDAYGAIIGVRTRLQDGSKRAYFGSRNGLFVPRGLEAGRPLLVCEGPTTCAALLSWGYEAIGRASATSCFDLVADFIRLRRCREVVLVAEVEASGVGVQSAEQLAQRLITVASSIRIITPPPGIKDARDWLRAGGTREDVDAAITAAPVLSLGVTLAGGRA